MAEKNVGKIVQIIGPVIDVEFEAGHLPEIYNALHVVSDGKGGAAALDVICEVEQHLGENRVRAVAMKPTDGMQRGMTAMDTATKNSAEMIGDLTLYMNKVRQAAITREIIEVVSGAEAL